MGIDWKIRYCPHCGEIDLLHIGDTCDFCNSKLIETEYIFDDVVDNGDVNPEIRQAIFEKYIKNSPQYSASAVKDRKEQEQYDMLHIGVPKSSMQSNNKTTCPYCKSTNVSKISTLGRSISVGLFGLGSSKVGKQWHCNGCKSDF